ncbi:hypothetical protein ALC62_00611 [Cyphomyrmex costatus]|uniref:Uncharacterized protein n=1 Tax=Cyphomyrmex costatus TaxID=456900 RepID=A0A151IQH3_9HYME|nr:hypothetical protein ALC62_00611 [Cyphomyrmex costatus]
MVFRIAAIKPGMTFAGGHCDESRTVTNRGYTHSCITITPRCIAGLRIEEARFKDCLC